MFSFDEGFAKFRLLIFNVVVVIRIKFLPGDISASKTLCELKEKRICILRSGPIFGSVQHASTLGLLNLPLVKETTSCNTTFKGIPRISVNEKYLILSYCNVVTRGVHC